MRSIKWQMKIKVGDLVRVSTAPHPRRPWLWKAFLKNHKLIVMDLWSDGNHGWVYYEGKRRFLNLQMYDVEVVSSGDIS